MKKFSLAALLASALFVSCQSTPEGYKIEGEVEGIQFKLVSADRLDFRLERI